MLAAWKQAIRTHSGKTWNLRIAKALEAVKDCNLQETKTRCQTREFDFSNQFKDMFEGELQLQENWNDQEARDRLNEAQTTLQQLHQG